MDKDDLIIKTKARLVVKVFSQVQDVDLFILCPYAYTPYTRQTPTSTLSGSLVPMSLPPPRAWSLLR